MLRGTDSGKLNRIALLGAFSMFLSTVEYLFPRPIPFMRLGLANLPLLLGLEVLPAPSYLLLVILKVLGQALVNGTLASYVFLFSLFGSLGSALVMYFSYRLLKKHISFVGISLLGALASNSMQIVLSVLFIFGSSAWRILPLFLGIGLVSGLFIGVFAQHFSERSRWWDTFRRNSRGEETESYVIDTNFEEEEKVQEKKNRRKRRPDRLALFLNPLFRFWTGLVLIPAYLFLDNPLAKASLVVLFGFLALMAGKKIRFGYYIILTASITFFHILTPMGRILFEIGPFRITSGALGTGVMKGLTLCGLIFISLFSVSGKLTLPGKLGGLLARTFYFFEEILEGKGRIRARDFIGSLDQVLLQLFPPAQLVLMEEPGSAEGAAALTGKKIPSFIYFFLLVGIVWGTLVWEKLFTVQ